MILTARDAPATVALTRAANQKEIVTRRRVEITRSQVFCGPPDDAEVPLGGQVPEVRSRLPGDRWVSPRVGPHEPMVLDEDVLAIRGQGSAPEPEPSQILQRSGNVDHAYKGDNVERTGSSLGQSAGFRRSMPVLYDDGSRAEGSCRA